MPPTLYAFMSCTETALIATITCSCVSCSNRQNPISNVCCACNRTYPHLRCDAVYSGKNLTFRRNILPQSSGCSGDEDNRCLRNVGKPLAGVVIPRQAAFLVFSTKMSSNLIIILRILLTTLAMFIYYKYKKQYFKVIRHANESEIIFLRFR
jgi:hypothetical protein